MSDVRTLKDKLKNSQEVTSLASSDRLMVIDAEGNLKGFANGFALPQYRYFKIDSVFRNKWIRIAAVGSLLAGSFNIVNVYNNNPSRGCVFNIVGGYVSNMLARVAPAVTSEWFPKVRIVYNASNSENCYLEIYSAMASRNDIVCLFSGTGCSLLNTVVEGEIPSGWIAIEFNLSSTIDSTGTLIYEKKGGG